MDPRKFSMFCENLRIDSKEKGLVPLRLYGGQKYVVDELISAINEDRRTVIILKTRQLGVSTISLALDLYWQFMYPGTQGALVTDTDTNREFFRSVLTDYFRSLPKSLKIPISIHNRNQLEFKNRSRLVYLTAGLRQTGGLGRGKALNFLHATETSSWGSVEDIMSLKATFAKEHPHRLYIFESTARGFNEFHDMYQEAKRAVSQKAIFVSWWRTPEAFTVPKGGNIFKVYSGKPSGEERIWVREIKELYGHDITEEQLAWWRWMLYEHFYGDINMMYQEYAPTEDYAFRAVGSQFFQATKITEGIKESRKLVYRPYRYGFGYHFSDIDLVSSSPKTATLKVWQEPHPNGVYVIGADPAYSSNPDSDNYCAEVYRCYADRMVQVAEFAAADIGTTQFAWVLAHLGGWYRNCMLNLEIYGGGSAVWNELQHLKDYNMRHEGASGNISNVIGNISNYVYRRSDSISTGGGSLHTITTPREKDRMMNHMRDAFHLDQLFVNSELCLEEMRYITQMEGSIGPGGKAGDDRVMATALAVIAWRDQLQWQLRSTSVFYKEESSSSSKEEPVDNPFSRMMKWYLKDRVGIT